MHGYFADEVLPLPYELHYIAWTIFLVTWGVTNVLDIGQKVFFHLCMIYSIYVR